MKKTQLNRKVDIVQRTQGFTLVELMIVVVILGLLAAIAIPTFSQYMRRAKTSEARDALAELYKGSVVYFSENHYNSSDGKIYSLVFPDSSSKQNPDPVPKGVKVKTTWNFEPWLSLNFQEVGLTYFSYNYLSTGATIVGQGANFTLQAKGDLDGDGQTSLFQRTGIVSSEGEIEASNLIETDPLE